FELRKAEERAETLEGYLIALANLDEFLRIIRGSANRDEARVKLLAFEFKTSGGTTRDSDSQSRALSEWPVCVQRAAGGRHSQSPPVSIDRPRARKDR